MASGRITAGSCCLLMKTDLITKKVYARGLCCEELLAKALLKVQLKLSRVAPALLVTNACRASKLSPSGW